MIKKYMIQRFTSFQGSKPNACDFDKIIERASELLNNTFVFDKTWDMEPCKTPYTISLDDWNVVKNNDVEWTFVLNRMDYLSYLIQAYQITEDEKYLQCVKRFIMSWIEKHSIMEQSLSTRTLDTAMRISAWSDSLMYLIGYNFLTDDEIDIIQKSIIQQIEYMYDNYLTKYQLSNWGSIQVCCILRLIPMLQTEKLNDIHVWAKKELMKQLEIQVYDDGIFWEQSTMYQVEVLMYLMKLYYDEKRLGNDIDQIIIDTIHQLLNTLDALTTPLHTIENFGDSDRTDTRGIFTSACIALETDKYRSRAYNSVDSDTKYEYGNKEYNQMDINRPKEYYFDGYDSGIYVVNTIDSYLMFTNGSLGSGHGHCDNLHYSYYFKNQPFLIDGGRYTYREDHPMRVKLKSMRAHQSIIIDGVPHSEPRDSWTNERFCLPLQNLSKHFDGIHYIHAALVDDHGMLHRRSLIQLNRGILIVFDDIKYEGNHNFAHYINLDPQVQVYNKKNTIVLENNDIKLQMYSSLNSFEMLEDVCSLCYNELENRFTIKQSGSFDHKECITTIFYEPGIVVEKLDVIQNGLHVVSDQFACAYKIHINKDEYYIIAHVTQEIYDGGKVLEVDGIPFHAKDLLIQFVDGEKKSYRLRT